VGNTKDRRRIKMKNIWYWALVLFLLAFGTVGVMAGSATTAAWSFGWLIGPWVIIIALGLAALLFQNKVLKWVFGIGAVLAAFGGIIGKTGESAALILEGGAKVPFFTNIGMWVVQIITWPFRLLVKEFAFPLFLGTESALKSLSMIGAFFIAAFVVLVIAAIVWGIRKIAGKK
jgi:hypothetical protein